jgi:hypothetical protein
MKGDAMSNDQETWRRIMEGVHRQRPKVLKWEKEQLRKLAPEVQNEVREMATRKTWEELLELEKQIEAQSKQLHLKAWFIGHLAMEKATAAFREREDAA